MIESILIISVFLNIVLISCIYLSDDCTELKLENQKLQLENKLLLREHTKMRQFLSYLKNNDVNVDFSSKDHIVIYNPKEDDFEEFVESLND